MEDLATVPSNPDLPSVLENDDSKKGPLATLKKMPKIHDSYHWKLL